MDDSYIKLDLCGDHGTWYMCMVVLATAVALPEVTACCITKFGGMCHSCSHRNRSTETVYTGVRSCLLVSLPGFVCESLCHHALLFGIMCWLYTLKRLYIITALTIYIQ